MGWPEGFVVEAGLWSNCSLEAPVTKLVREIRRWRTSLNRDWWCRDEKIMKDGKRG